MKALTITYQHVINYGALLQAYALAKFLNKNKVETKVIDYRPVFFMIQTYKPAKGFGKTLKKISKLIKFYKFRKKHLPLTSTIYFSAKSLNKIQEETTLICGSDQIWNPLFTKGKLDDGYFLNFGNPKSKRLSYAASLGSIDYDTFRPELENRLSKFDKIGLREEKAKEIIGTYGLEKDLQVVLDPSMLLTKEEYQEELFSDLKPIQEEFILCYQTEDGIYTKEVLLSLKERFNLPIYNVGHFPVSIADKNLLNLSPSEWLNYFNKASFILTNSFHGLAYSIIFRRNFLVLARTTYTPLNQRQLTLLEQFNIKGRYAEKPEDIQDSMYEAVDYNENEIVEVINKSKSFLLDEFYNHK